ncbi:cysteinyl leukotriene receptor 2-like [Mytilus galloprovincialis]|uniref:cysteinyl leukotriene receptor 2-like n=1 Tax=Mytilus galloprovincialis TaxID=29158 RepID=UPI003F7C6F4D
MESNCSEHIVYGIKQIPAYYRFPLVQTNFSLNSDCNCENNFWIYSEYNAAIYLWKIVPPILLLLGTVGNVLSILVLRRPTIRKSVCSLYLVMLAIIDLLVLYTGILRQWILNTFDFDIRATSSAACKIHIWILYSSMDYSAWILIAVTIERVLLLWFPNKMQCVCTKKVAMLVLISIASFLLLVNSHILYGYELSNGKTANHCHYVSKSYLQFWIFSWPSIDLVIFCIIPGSFLVVGNILIFVKVLISRRAINRQVSTYSTSSQQRRDSKFSSMTAMLIAVNCVFLVCNIPSRAFMIENTSWSFDTCGHNYAKMSLLWCIFNLLMYVNNSVNFLLYIISGSRFRNEIKEIFKRRKQNHIAAALIPNRPLAIKIRNSSDIYTITQNVSSEKMLDSKC